MRVLHIEYFYNGNYPRETVQEEFGKWLKKVEEYVGKLEAEVKVPSPSENKA